jgi:CHC2 zinc finger
MDFEAWIARARAVPIESEIIRRRIQLKRSGQERVGPCPKCGGTDRFSVNVRDGVWNCRQCKPSDISGDVIGLVEFLEGIGFNEAVEYLTGEARQNGSDIGSNRSAWEEIRRRRADHPVGNGDDPDQATFRDDELGPVVASYDYTDESGRLLYQVTRHAFPEKTFRQRRPNGNGGWIHGTKGVAMVPYHLPELTEAIALEQLVFIVEGEKDVDNLIQAGAPATCNPRGAGKWASCKIDSFFTGADVIIIADNDPQAKNKKTGELLVHPDGRPRFAGWDHAHEVAAHLAPIAVRVRLIDLKRLWPDCPEKATSRTGSRPVAHCRCFILTPKSSTTGRLPMRCSRLR